VSDMSINVFVKKRWYFNLAFKYLVWQVKRSNVSVDDTAKFVSERLFIYQIDKGDS